MNSKYKMNETDLKTTYPEIAKEWDYEKNEGRPEEYFHGSTEYAYWICSKCGNKWKTTIRTRTRKGTACPICAVKKRTKKRADKILKERGGIVEPILLKEWDYEKNEGRPENYTKGSNKSVYWVCSKCGHSYKAKIGNRTYLNRSCPLCANSVIVSGKNDLMTTHPEIAAEWDFEKNGELTPDKISYGSGKKIWWKCPEGHSYRASVLHRTTGGTNCPVCNAGRQTSFAEQAIFYYVKKLYSDAINRYTDIFNNGMELDIYIPSLKLGIEYDGEAWHGKYNSDRELRKYKICQENGIKLLRLREASIEGINLTADYFLHMDKMYEHDNLQNVIRLVIDKLDRESNPLTRRKAHMFHSAIDINVKRDEKKIRSYMTALNKGSLEELYPQIAAEWDYKRNESLKPNMVKPSSDVKVFWLCKECGFSYETTIGKRTSGTGCPKCGIKKSASAKMKSVAKIDPKTGDVICIYKSITKASIENNINASNISMVCKGTRKKAGGFIWRYNNANENELQDR